MFTIYTKVFGAILICAITVSFVSVIYAVAENFFIRIKVRFSHNKQLKTFYEQCSEFLTEIQKANDFFVLLALRKKIDAYMITRLSTGYEQEMKRKIYRAYYTRQAMLLPRTDGLNVLNLKF